VVEQHRVAVVGLGIGQSHVWSWRRMKDRFTVVAVSDLDESVARETAERIRGEALTFEQLLARDDIDVIDLCTPPSLHLDQIVAVLEAGKHVVCEKPLVSSLADCDALAVAEAAAPGRVMPIFQYRYGGGLQEVKALVDAGAAGQAYTSSVEVSWRRDADYYAVPWRGQWATALGGVLLSQAIHALDMLTYVVGPATRVFCRAKTMVNDVEVEDCAAASLEMADGSLATVSATLGSAQEITRHRFHFAGFSAESGTSPYQSASAPWDVTPATEAAAAELERLRAAQGKRAEDWWGQFERYAGFLDGAAADPPVTLADARASIELLTALYDSARRGVDVTLPMEPDHPLYRGWLP